MIVQLITKRRIPTPWNEIQKGSRKNRSMETLREEGEERKVLNGTSCEDRRRNDEVVKIGRAQHIGISAACMLVRDEGVEMNSCCWRRCLMLLKRFYQRYAYL